MSNIQKIQESQELQIINCESLGNFNHLLLNSIAESFAGDSPILRELSKENLNQMKISLGYPSSSFMEKMLIDEIVMRWLRLQVMESDHKNVTYRNHSFREGMYYDKRLHLAQKRYLRAVEALAKVRKLIAETQTEGAKIYRKLVSKNDR